MVRSYGGTPSSPVGTVIPPHNRPSTSGEPGVLHCSHESVVRSHLVTCSAVPVFNVGMDAEQLSELEERLRSFANEHGMSWVVDELDEAISLGLFERRELRPSSSKGKTVYNEVPKVATGTGRKRAEEFVSRRPLTPEEQVQLLLSALRRVLVDLDQVAAASVTNLNDLESVTQSVSDVESTESSIDKPPREFPRVTEIDFAPDEGSIAPAVTTEGLRHARRSERTARALSRIKAEVDS